MALRRAESGTRARLSVRGYGKILGVPYLWYLIWIAIATGWVFFDARARQANRYWVAAVVMAGPIGLAAYLALRPLREGESREGGRAWQLLSMLVASWTALAVFAVLWNAAFPFADMANIAVVWACIAVPALVLGLALKRNTTEHGPTGMLGAMNLWFRGPERTEDGRAYVCLECGKEYPIELRFCVGDAPIIGAGTYANNQTCAVSCTGDGEYFIRSVVAHDLSAMMEYKGMTVKTAAQAAIDKVGKLGGTGGLIAIDKEGNFAMPFNTSGMYRGTVGSDGKIRVEIYR